MTVIVPWPVKIGANEKIVASLCFWQHLVRVTCW
jgi:hypothetical protein